MSLAVVGFGASLGDGRSSIELALRMLCRRPGAGRDLVLLGTSRLYRSPPAGGRALRPFLNAAALVSTRLPPGALLARCRAVERRLGRRPGPRWGDRVVDLDLLVYDDLVVERRGLRLPHPRLAGRPFALWPLLELLPSARDPRSGTPWASLARRWPQPACVGAPLAPRPRLEYPVRPPSPQRGSDMQIFIDTANLEQIRRAASWGVVSGVTTNPSLIAREGGDFVETIAEICTLVDGPVSAEVVASDVEGMVRQGRLLSRIHDNVVVKVPLGQAGIAATSRLAKEGIRVNVTLCFQPAQALLAARAGATFVSPFIGRIDDTGADGVEVVGRILQIFGRSLDIETQVLAASIRHPMHVCRVAELGCDAATIPYGVIEKLFLHPLTERGNERFLADWRSVPDPDMEGQVSRWLQRRGR